MRMYNIMSVKRLPQLAVSGIWLVNYIENILPSKVGFRSFRKDSGEFKWNTVSSAIVQENETADSTESDENRVRHACLINQERDARVSDK